jgi:hypothetical protein
MADAKNYEDKIPFRFILDHLVGVDIVIKPMFGCFGVYAHGKLCLFLMDRERPLERREGQPMQKGIYVATRTEFCASLKEHFPAAEFEQLKGDKVWIFVSAALIEFEDYVVRACEMIRTGSPQIGR